MPHGPKPGFTCVYVLKKPKPMKKFICGTSRGEIYGVDPPSPTDRCFLGGMTAGATESYQNLHVDLGYAWKCGGMCDSPPNGARHSSPV